MDAARKRAQRRAIFLAKRRGDPQQSIQVIGSRCRTYRDDGLYQATQDQQGLSVSLPHSPSPPLPLSLSLSLSRWLGFFRLWLFVGWEFRGFQPLEYLREQPFSCFDILFFVGGAWEEGLNAYLSFDADDWKFFKSLIHSARSRKKLNEKRMIFGPVWSTNRDWLEQTWKKAGREFQLIGEGVKIMSLNLWFLLSYVMCVDNVFCKFGLILGIRIDLCICSQSLLWHAYIAVLLSVNI